MLYELLRREITADLECHHSVVSRMIIFKIKYHPRKNLHQASIKLVLAKSCQYLNTSKRKNKLKLKIKRLSNVLAVVLTKRKVNFQFQKSYAITVKIILIQALLIQ